MLVRAFQPNCLNEPLQDIALNNIPNIAGWAPLLLVRTISRQLFNQNSILMITMLTSILSRLRPSWFPPFVKGHTSTPTTSRDPEISPLDIEDEPLEIAIIGCGIIGAILALGLLAKNIKVTVYEQAQSPRESGAGIAFTANARRCMSMIDERIVDCVAAVATTNGDPRNPNNNMQFIDGYTHDPDGLDDMSWKKLYALATGPKGFEGCHRAHFLEEIMRLIPGGVVKLGKRLDRVEDYGVGKVLLRFCDGSVGRADAGEFPLASELDLGRTVLI